MSFEGGSLNASLIAAVGDDPALLSELRRAFVESADRQMDMLSNAADASSWQTAIWRMKGLAGSFGAVNVLALLGEAEHSAPGDAKTLRRLRSALSLLSVD
jgi:hypothetical protein